MGRSKISRSGPLKYFAGQYGSFMQLSYRTVAVFQLPFELSALSKMDRSSLSKHGTRS